MTTIVANRTGMASDSQLSDERAGTKNSCKKFWRIRGWLIGAAGDYSAIIRVLNNIRAHKDKSPIHVLNEFDMKVPKDETVDLLILSPSGHLYLSENGKDAMPITDGFAAIGSGCQGAMVAMHMGASPADAVRAVKKVDPSTGGRIVQRKL
jgi:ATP-dependent protease HslVU (ClpYQ) peptidase subunit